MYIPSSTLANNFPLPLHGPPPWPSPTYYTGQLPYKGLIPLTSNILQPHQAMMKQQTMEPRAIPQVINPGSFKEQGTMRQH